MPGWTELREDLRRISRDSPGALIGYPDPDSDRAVGERLSVELAASAADIAAVLHEKYGAEVELRVGAMPYPAPEQPHPAWRTLPDTPAGSVGLSVEPVSPLSVPSGAATTATVRVLNHVEVPRSLSTNGHLQSAVVDDAGRVVGRYVGPQHLPHVGFVVEPGRSTEVPVLIGTDSMAPELGYAVPPGHWGLVVVLDTDEGKTVSLPVPLEVTPAPSRERA